MFRYKQINIQNFAWFAAAITHIMHIHKEWSCVVTSRLAFYCKGVFYLYINNTANRNLKVIQGNCWPISLCIEWLRREWRTYWDQNDAGIFQPYAFEQVQETNYVVDIYYIIILYYWICIVIMSFSDGYCATLSNINNKNWLRLREWWIYSWSLSWLF